MWGFAILKGKYYFMNLRIGNTIINFEYFEGYTWNFFINYLSRFYNVDWKWKSFNINWPLDQHIYSVATIISWHSVSSCNILTCQPGAEPGLVHLISLGGATWTLIL